MLDDKYKYKYMQFCCIELDKNLKLCAIKNELIQTVLNRLFNLLY